MSNPFVVELTSKIQADFFSKYGQDNLFVPVSPGDRELLHVLACMEAMEQEIIHKQQAGSFVHAVCTGQYGQAIDSADMINLKFLFVYRKFELFLKELIW